MKLLNKCPSCKREIPYLFDDECFESGYKCICGHEFSSGKLTSRNIYVPYIKESKMNKWINVSGLKKGDLSEVKFLEDFAGHSRFTETDYTYTHQDLNNFIQKKHIVRSRPFVYSLSEITNNRRIYLLRTNDARYYKLFPEYYNSDYFEDSYDTTFKIFSSIARHFRKTILRNHIVCIKKYARNKEPIGVNDICPFAMAYVHWRQRRQGFKAIEYVDNGGTIPLYRYSVRQIGFPIGHYLKFLISFYRQEYDIPNKYIHYFNWHINRIVGEIIKSDFNNFLAASIDYLTKGKEFAKALKNYNYMPHLIMKEFTDENTDYFIYKRPERKLSELLLKCQCPAINPPSFF
ncbi:hypothetical protein [Bacillus canaveralius]|uniref:hypothetical protein n=1 Tax=Bacillus canaveralius TaxID=1403243 RepID=UPI000F767BA9|nr:hypothetical protein [Bacillus canaveralius]RSK49683.1 hypothetical protein EJA13_15505 [Bacillus canaveralius]